MSDNQALERRRWEKQNTRWIIFSYCLLGFVPFLKIGTRVKQIKWIVAGAIYALIFFGMIFTASEDNPLSGRNNETANRVRTVIFLAYYVGSIIHCHLVKKEYLRRLAELLAEQNKYPFSNVTSSQPVYSPVNNNYVSNTSSLCPKCGTISAGSFCNNCGTSLKNLNFANSNVSPTANHCPRCGSVTAGKFCSTCGTLVAPDNSQHLTNNVDSNACPKCGRISYGKFCGYCGMSKIAVNNPASTTKGYQEQQKINTYTSTSNKFESAPIDVNTCEESVFESLPGISAVMAKRLIDYRSANKGFSSIDEFIRIAELKPHFAIQVRNQVTCSVKAQSQDTQSDRRLDI